MAPRANSTVSACPGKAADLRSALCEDFPEINSLCSERYLLDVLSVPNRKFEYARDEKIRKSLEWRREYGVASMCSRFRYDNDSCLLQLLPADNVQDAFQPSPALLKLCQSSALRIMPNRDEDGRIVLFAETQLLDWHAAGVDAGVKYHILVIEAALSIIRSENGSGPESMLLVVDASGPMLAKPPPMAALQGLVSLLQRAYPDRIHRILVGPVNLIVRGLYHMAARFMSQNSRHKIKLSGSKPKMLIGAHNNHGSGSTALRAVGRQVSPAELCFDEPHIQAQPVDVSADVCNGSFHDAEEKHSDSSLSDEARSPAAEDAPLRDEKLEKRMHIDMGEDAESSCFSMFECCTQRTEPKTRCASLHLQCDSPESLPNLLSGRA